MGDRGVIAGGYGVSGLLDSIEYITISTEGNGSDFGELVSGNELLGGNVSNSIYERGLFFGGDVSGYFKDLIQYITINTIGNAIDLSDLTIPRILLNGVSNSTGDRGVFAGGALDETASTNYDVIDYKSISTTANATDFGDLAAESLVFASMSNATNQRGVFNSTISSTSGYLEYITINSAGNSTSFGDLSIDRYVTAGCSNGTNERGIIGGGLISFPTTVYSDIIDYITINSTGNATDFGDLVAGRWELGCTSNSGGQRGVFSGGSLTFAFYAIMDYVTINTLGNASYFGSLYETRRSHAANNDAKTHSLSTITKWQSGVDVDEFQDIMELYRPDYQFKYLLAGGLVVPNFTPAIGDRGIFMGGYYNTDTYSTVIQYITISSTGNAQDFGDLIVARISAGCCSNNANDRGLIFAGQTTGGGNIQAIDYVTISVLGNASDFGDLGYTKRMCSACSNGTNERGINGVGGFTTNEVNSIDYVTINSPSNGTDFGDAINNIRNNAGTSNATNERGVFNGGRLDANYRNYIQYITINSTGNATDAANLTAQTQSPVAVSNGTNERATVCGGFNSGGRMNKIDYYTINSISNAADFGDLINSVNTPYGCSNGTNERGVVAGGYNGSSYVNVIQYITISTTGNATDFGDLIQISGGTDGCSNS